MGLRLRLQFDGSCGIGKDKNPRGVLQWWYAVPQSMATIADVAAGIVAFFHLGRFCPHGVLLLMEDFALPPLQSVGLLSDRDIITVKRLEFPADIALTWGQTPQDNHDGNKVLRICAQDEFEKESGGYKSEDEELALTEESPKNRLKSRLKTVLKPISKIFKHKAGKTKDKKVKKRKRGEGDGEVMSKKRDNKKNKKPIAVEEIESVEGSSDADEDSDENDNQLGKEIPKTNEECKEPTKSASRSSRRKKAKRAWLRANKAEAPQENNDRNIHISAAKHTVVAPGHIRFEPLDSDGKENVQVAMNFGGGVKSKKQGQSWGQQKRSGRQEKSWSNAEADQFPESKTDEEHKIISPQEDPVNFNSLPLLQGIPEEGDVLAYKMVELSAAGTPEVSSFRVGKVAAYDTGSSTVKLVPVSDYPLEKESDEAEFREPYQEDGSLEVHISFLVEARILHGKNNIETDSTAAAEASIGKHSVVFVDYDPDYSERKRCSSREQTRRGRRVHRRGNKNRKMADQIDESRRTERDTTKATFNRIRRRIISFLREDQRRTTTTIHFRRRRLRLRQHSRSIRQHPTASTLDHARRSPAATYRTKTPVSRRGTPSARRRRRRSGSAAPRSGG